MVVAAFLAAIAIGTLLLQLPLAYDGYRRVAFMDAVFSATSAVTVTGLGTFDIGQMSLFGELVVLVLIQVGGFGIMTIGSLLALFASRRMGLRQRILAQAELGAVDQDEMKNLVYGIAGITAAIEVTVAIILATRLWIAHDVGMIPALYQGFFHSISAFNNAGISLWSEGLTPFVGDPIITLAISGAFIVGGLGFPILVQFLRRTRPRNWSLHTRITLSGVALLIVAGPLMIALFEWTNPDTLGPLDLGGKLLASWFQGVSPRTAGFATVNIAEMNEPTLLGVSALMFIGGGPASTAGGIKVTTFALLGFVLWSEVRGDTDINVFHRRLAPTVVRQAVTVVILAIGSIVTVTLIILATTDVTLTPALFESTSAFATVGLSTGLTPELPFLAKASLVLLMVAGRVGPTTLVTALAYRQRLQTFRYPEDRPIIG